MNGPRADFFVGWPATLPCAQCGTPTAAGPSARTSIYDPVVCLECRLQQLPPLLDPRCADCGRAISQALAALAQAVGAEGAPRCAKCAGEQATGRQSAAPLAAPHPVYCLQCRHETTALQCYYAGYGPLCPACYHGRTPSRKPAAAPAPAPLPSGIVRDLAEKLTAVAAVQAERKAALARAQSRYDSARATYFSLCEQLARATNEWVAHEAPSSTPEDA